MTRWTIRSGCAVRLRLAAARAASCGRAWEAWLPIGLRIAPAPSHASSRSASRRSAISAAPSRSVRSVRQAVAEGRFLRYMLILTDSMQPGRNRPSSINHSHYFVLVSSHPLPRLAWAISCVQSRSRARRIPRRIPPPWLRCLPPASCLCARTSRAGA